MLAITLRSETFIRGTSFSLLEEACSSELVAIDEEDEWLSIECALLERDTALRELRSRQENESLCDLLASRADPLFFMYWNDVDNVDLSPTEYRRIDDHLKGCYSCCEAYNTFLYTIPPFFREAIELRRARDFIKRLFESTESKERMERIRKQYSYLDELRQDLGDANTSY